MNKDIFIYVLATSLFGTMLIGAVREPTLSTPTQRERAVAQQRAELDAIVKKNRAAFQAEHDMPGPADPVKKCLNDCHVEHCDCHIRCAEVEDPMVCAQRCNDDEKQCQRKCDIFQSMVPR